MYLFVYIFLMLSVIGLYSQLFLLQAAEEKNQQFAPAEAIFTWHRAAHDLILDMNVTPAPGTVCSVMSGDTVTACTHVLQDPGAGVPFGYNRHYLPAGYNFDQKFSSLVYVLGGQRYVATYLVADATPLGFTSAEIQTQMKRTDLPMLVYGEVKTGTCEGVAGRFAFTTQYIQTGGSVYRVCYPVPNEIPNDSLVFVTLP